MIKKALLILMIILALFLAGCIQENSTEPENSNNWGINGTTLENGNNATGLIGYADMPFIEENDTVEIGEMI